MARPTRLTIAKKDILKLFEKSSKRVFSVAELSRILTDNRDFWRLTRRTTAAEFIGFLEKQAGLKSIVFKSEAYNREIVRYSWEDASIYELALSLYPRGYLSHGTAVELHGLNDLLPTALYLNVEQSAKPPPSGGLTQRGIDLAFSRNQRQSNMIYHLGDRSVTIMNGKHTDALGVETILGPSDEQLRATNLERTLIDIVVRPAYAGGIFQVLQAYHSARDKVSTNRMLATLKKLNYIYPYHQAIGFLMERAGYAEKRFAHLKQLGVNLDFYLTHAMKDPEYSRTWRIYYPKGI